MKLFIYALIVTIFIKSNCVIAKDGSNATDTIIDVFEADDDLRFAADTFCREYTLSNPLAKKVVLPYKKNCHYWWECTTYELKKKECQGLAHRINLHYNLYLDRCEEPSVAKCKFEYDEEEIIMEAIMEYYKKSSTNDKE